MIRIKEPEKEEKRQMTDRPPLKSGSYEKLTCSTTVIVGTLYGWCIS